MKSIYCSMIKSQQKIYGGAMNRRGILTLGLVLCMVIFFTLAALLWNYQYMVLVNQDINLIADLTMYSTEKSRRDDLETFAKAQFNYGVVNYNAGELWGDSNSKVGPFPLRDATGNPITDISEEFHEAVEVPLKNMKELVDESSKAKMNRIYKTASFNNTGATDGEKIKPLKTITVGINGFQAYATSDAPGEKITVRPGTAVFLNPSSFDDMITSRISFYRYRDLHFFQGIFSHDDTKSLAGNSKTLLEEVEDSFDAAGDLYVAADPYVYAVNDEKMKVLGYERFPYAFHLDWFNGSDMDFLKKFHSEGTTFTITWNYDNRYNPGNILINSIAKSGTGFFDTGSGNDYQINTTSLAKRWGGTPQENVDWYKDYYDDLKAYYEYLNDLKGTPDYQEPIFWVPVVKENTSGNKGTTADFLAFKINGIITAAEKKYYRDDPPGERVYLYTEYQTSLTLTPVNLVISSPGAVSTNKTTRESYLGNLSLLNDVRFNRVHCNTTISELKVSRKPIFPAAAP
ncbi:MAG: hypothetical protein Q4C96_10455 [Planctomycetia bacterium]|nr:hypothetical protein [Planctomycetia bacterium]